MSDLRTIIRQSPLVEVLLIGAIVGVLGGVALQAFGRPADPAVKLSSGKVTRDARPQTPRPL